MLLILRRCPQYLCHAALAGTKSSLGCVVSRRRLCHAAFAATKSSIGLPSLYWCQQSHLRHSTSPQASSMAAAACAAPAGCRKERLLRWRHITFSQDEGDNDLVRIIYARAEIGLINDSSSSATAILLYYIHCCPAIYCSAAVHESNLRLMVSFSRLLLS